MEVESGYFFPLGRITCSIQCVNLFFEKKENYTYSFLTSKRKTFKIDFEQHLGNTIIQVNDCHIYDMLNLFSKKLNQDITIEHCFFPTMFHQTKPESRHQLEAWIHQYNQNKSDEYDLREYRIGDSLKDIHYKISYKTNEIIIKDKYQNSRIDMNIFLDLSGNEQECEEVFKKANVILDVLFSSQSSCTFFWISKKQLYQADMKNYEEGQKVYLRILSMPKADSCIEGFDGIFLSSKGGIRYE